MQGSGGNSHPRQRGVLPGSEFTVVVGTDNGLVKVVRSWMEEEGERKTVLHTQWGTPSKDLEVERIAPSPLSAGEVFVCRKNGEIALHNVDSGKVIRAFRNKAKEGKWVGLHCWAESGRFLSCDAKGHVQYWKLSQEVGLEEEEASLCETAAEELQMRAPISQFRIDPVESLKGAFGGNENELKVWDMEQKKQIWEAKNVANDFLDMRVPVWINDLQFLPQDPNKIVTGTAYHQIRLYDITAQRRPVLNASCGENPVISLCIKPHGRSVIFADTVGNVTEVDLRNGKSLGSYKGISGAIQGLDISPSGGEEGVVCSASLDRFLRLHDAQSRRLLLKVYLKQRLNSLVVMGEGACSSHALRSSGGNAHAVAEEQDEQPEEHLMDKPTSTHPQKRKREGGSSSTATTSSSNKTSTRKKKKKTPQSKQR